MNTTFYRATLDNIGPGWDGDEEIAVEAWNEHIAPVLRSAHDEIDAPPGDPEFVAVERLAERAWGLFCERTVGRDIDDVAREIADELAAPQRTITRLPDDTPEADIAAFGDCDRLLAADGHIVLISPRQTPEQLAQLVAAGVGF